LRWAAAVVGATVCRNSDDDVEINDVDIIRKNFSGKISIFRGSHAKVI
jgi:hypothetical protein